LRFSESFASRRQRFDGRFDDPAFGENCESLDTIGAPDNLRLDVRQDARQGLVERTPLMGGVSKELVQERSLICRLDARSSIRRPNSTKESPIRILRRSKLGSRSKTSLGATRLPCFALSITARARPPTIGLVSDLVPARTRQFERLPDHLERSASLKFSVGARERDGTVLIRRNELRRSWNL
jgi:hypothetical protein